MNKNLKKMLYNDYKNFIVLSVIFIFALVLSAFIFIFIGQQSSANLSYKNIIKLPFDKILFMMLRRNIIYLIAIIFLTISGKNKFIYAVFSMLSIFYGLSAIYLIKAMMTDKIYFIFLFSDFFILFPILFYFTYISGSISKYTKKSKKIETISARFDIIVSSYIILSLIYILIVLIYSFCYSYYIIILSRLLVK